MVRSVDGDGLARRGWGVALVAGASSLLALSAACSTAPPPPADAPDGGGEDAWNGHWPDEDAGPVDAARADLGPWEPPPDEPYPLDLPPRFPRPRVPAHTPLRRPVVELGRHLFYDTRLSGNGTMSCATCHQQARAFTDGRALAVGSTGELHFRHSMSLVNVAYNSQHGWASTLHPELEEQMLIPLFGEEPVELGLAGRDREVFERLRAEPRYQRLFPLAFPADADPFTLRNLVRAIAAFERVILSYRTPFDRYAFGGEVDALSEAAKRGEALFFSEDLECFHCHGGFNFANSVTHEGTVFDETTFHNTGLYNVDGRGAYPAHDTGLMRQTGDPAHMGRFRAPTLRNVMITAPYMHDGSIADIDGAIDHYARGGRLIVDGPYAGDGRRSPLKSEFVRGFSLSPQQREDLKAFLSALTDEALIRDPALANPWDGR
jgi:cytochrome c peroxidase